MRAVIFPGQGAQYPGMGKDLAESFSSARKLFSQIDACLGIKISEICFAGQPQTLKDTYYQQLAILSTSLVAYELFKERGIDFSFLSGLSLGEYTCLYPAGVLSLEGVLYLVKERAQAMQEAAKRANAGMLAVLGLELKILEESAKENDFYISNINSEAQVVISLAEDKKEKIKHLLEGLGAKVIELEVSGGFHSPFMEPAKERLVKALEGLDFKDAKIPIVSNFTARPHTDRNEIKQNLLRQLTSSVLWKDCVEYMIGKGVDTFFEIGPGRVLNGLVRKINPGVQVINIEKKDDLEGI